VYPLSRATLLDAAIAGAARLAEQQVVAPGDALRGALIRPDWGIDDPTTSCGFVATAAMVCAGETALGRAPSATVTGLVDRAQLACAYVRRYQRPSGLVDLRDCNYDSSPDAGFLLQSLCAALDLCRRYPPSHAGWEGLARAAESLVRSMAPAMATGGFHTPNHRWVIASALAQAQALYPDLRLQPALDAYLAEGFDIDDDGFFLERSVGVYDGICDRSLLLIAETTGRERARAAAHRNLEADLYLLHADGTCDSGLSRRQDLGARTVPMGLAGPYLLAGLRDSAPLFVAAAERLWRAASASGPVGDFWMLHALLLCGDPPPERAPLPDDYARWMRANGLWRVRRGALSASFWRGSTRLMALVSGEAELAALRISQSYFGVGRFVADRMTVSGGRARMESDGLSRLHRPGYEQPLGRPVPPERYEAVLPERAWRPAPPCAAVLDVEEAPGGFDLRFQSSAALDRVTAQIALDFSPGGWWETGDTATATAAGQTLFLKRGAGRMRYGHDVIEVGPGADEHRMVAMRDAEPAPAHARVVIALQTPADHTLRIRCRREP